MDYYVKPTDGRIVRDPSTRKALPTGRYTRVPKTSYWTRRVKGGDVELRPAKATPRKAQATSKGES